MSLAALPLLLLAQVAPSPPHHVATRASSTVTLDGRLDEAAWREAATATIFTQKYPDEGSAPSEPTSVRVLFDDHALYVGFECVQKQSRIVERLTRRDREVEADRVSVIIGSRADRKSAYEFTVNAAGALVDVLRYDDTEVSADWDEVWEARTARTSDGWSAEFKIPLRILRFAADAKSFDLQLRRYVSERQEIDEWSFIPRNAAGEVSRYGFLDGLRGLGIAAPIELRPFVLGKVRRIDAGGSELDGGSHLSGSAGLDVKWHPTHALTLDATLNPDFAQVEADQQVLNLTTFEVYYPEKRPFFLEGTDVFATQKQLLYTRRIGGAAAAPELRLDAPFNERLVRLPSPATLYGASKLTGTIGDRFQVGVLQAVTGENHVDVQSADGSRARRTIEPLSGTQVVRLKGQLFDNGYVGAMLTSKTRAEGSLGYPASSTGPSMQFCPNGATVRTGTRCFNDAYAAATDWRWRSAGGEWVTGGQLTASMLHGGPDRLVLDGTVIRSGDLGAGAFAFLRKEGGTHWVGEATFEYAGAKLDYNDVGYNPRANDYRWSVDVEYRELDKWWKFYESRARLEYYGRTNLDGLWLGSGYQANVSGRLANFWRVFTELHWRPSYFDDREIGDGAALQRAGLAGYELELASDPTKRVSFKLSSTTQLTSNGFIETADAGVLVRAMSALDVEVLPTLTHTFGEPRFVEVGANPGEYIFGRLAATGLGATIRATYTFTPRLTLQAYGQLFLASAHYDDLSSFVSAPGARRPAIRLTDMHPYTTPLRENPDFEEGALNLNMVLRWEYTLGSTLFFVYTRAQTPVDALQSGERARLDFNAVRRAPASDVFLIKLTYWWAPG